MDRVLVLFGGRSAEHSISCLSGASVLQAIDATHHEVVPVGITRTGRWVRGAWLRRASAESDLPEVDAALPACALVPIDDGAEVVEYDASGRFTWRSGRIDVAFPVLHGVGGEDGSIQGLLESFGVPYVGAGIAASSIGMHKGAMKAAFARAGLPQTPHAVVDVRQWRRDAAAVRTQALELGGSWFVKPARQGSSIGITRVEWGDTDVRRALDAALLAAFGHDDDAIIEVAVDGARELELGVLEEDGVLSVTPAGEIVSAHPFYDFAAKYLDDSQLIVPASLSPDVAAEAEDLARRAFAAIGCRGMARVDLFLTPDGRLLVNEINTIPGFTHRSMFPRLWEAAGVTYVRLVDRLLAAAR